MTYKQILTVSRMSYDARIPRNALGYVVDLAEQNATKTFLVDRLRMLERYVPDLVAEYAAEMEGK